MFSRVSGPIREISKDIMNRRNFSSLQNVADMDSDPCQDEEEEKEKMESEKFNNNETSLPKKRVMRRLLMLEIAVSTLTLIFFSVFKAIMITKSITTIVISVFNSNFLK